MPRRHNRKHQKKPCAQSKNTRPALRKPPLKEAHTLIGILKSQSDPHAMICHLEKFLARKKISIDTLFSGYDRPTEVTYESVTLLYLFVAEGLPSKFIELVEEKFSPNWELEAQITQRRKKLTMSVIRLIVERHNRLVDDVLLINFIKVYASKPERINRAFTLTWQGVTYTASILSHLLFCPFASTEARNHLARYLLEQGANPNLRGNDKRTVMHHAIENHDLGLLDILIKHRKTDLSLRLPFRDLTWFNLADKSYIDVAFQYGHVETIMFLLNHENMDDKEISFGTIFFLYEKARNIALLNHPLIRVNTLSSDELLLTLNLINKIVDENGEPLLPNLSKAIIEASAPKDKEKKEGERSIFTKKVLDDKEYRSQTLLTNTPAMINDVDATQLLFEIIQSQTQNIKLIEKYMHPDIDTSEVCYQFAEPKSILALALYLVSKLPDPQKGIDCFVLLCRQATDINRIYINGCLLEIALDYELLDYIEILIMAGADVNVTTKEGEPFALAVLKKGHTALFYEWIKKLHLNEDSIEACVSYLLNDLDNAKITNITKQTIKIFRQHYHQRLRNSFWTFKFLATIRQIELAQLQSPALEEEKMEKVKSHAENLLIFFRDMDIYLNTFRLFTNPASLGLDEDIVVDPVVDTEYKVDTCLLSEVIKHGDDNLSLRVLRLHRGKIPSSDEDYYEHPLLVAATMNKHKLLHTMYDNLMHSFTADTRLGKEITKALESSGITIVDCNDDASAKSFIQSIDTPSTSDVLKPHAFFKQKGKQLVLTTTTSSSEESDEDTNELTWLDGNINVNHPRVRKVRNSFGCTRYMILMPDSLDDELYDAYKKVCARMTISGDGMRPLSASTAHVDVTMGDETSRHLLTHELKRVDSKKRIMGFSVTADQNSTPLIIYCIAADALHTKQHTDSFMSKKHRCTLSFVEKDESAEPTLSV